MGVTEKYARLASLPEGVIAWLEKLADLWPRHEVRLVYLFGSAACGERPRNDIDLAVLAGAGFSYPALYADLSLALNTDRLDLVDLRVAPSYLQAEIISTGWCLWRNPQEDRFRFEQKVRMRWRDDRMMLLKRAIARRKEGRAMVLRREFLEQAFSELDRVAQELGKYRDTTAEKMAADLSRRWIVERGLLAGVNLLLQVADHILTQHFGRLVDTYEGLLAELRGNGVISAALYERLRGAGGFRNVLVHEYLDIDLREVAKALRQAPDAFREFVREVAGCPRSRA